MYPFAAKDTSGEMTRWQNALAPCAAHKPRGWGKRERRSVHIDKKFQFLFSPAITENRKTVNEQNKYPKPNSPGLS